MNDQPYSFSDFSTDADDDARKAVFLAAVNKAYDRRFSQYSQVEREKLLRQIGLLDDIEGKLEFTFNRYPVGAFQSDEFSSACIPDKIYKRSYQMLSRQFFEFIFDIISNQDKDRRITRIFDLSITNSHSGSATISIEDMDVIQSEKIDSRSPLKYNVKLAGCYIGDLDIVLSSEVIFKIVNCNSIYPESVCKFDLYTNSNLEIKSSKLNRISLVNSERRGGEIVIYGSELNIANFNSCQLNAISIKGCDINALSGGGEVAHSLSINAFSSIGNLGLGVARISEIDIASSTIGRGALPGSSDISKVEMTEVTVGAEGGALTMNAPPRGASIASLQLLDLKVITPFRIRGWRIGTASLQRVELSHAIDFTGTQFASEPNVGDIKLAPARGGEGRKDGHALDEIETGLRPLTRAMESYGNFNSAYKLKQIEAQIHGLRPIGEVGFASWLTNHIYKIFSDYGVNSNRPPVIFAILATIFMLMGGFSLIFFDGWEFTGKASDALRVSQWLFESFLNSTPIGITFDISEPAWVEYAPQTQVVVRYLSVLFGSASYVLFFLFFLAIRRRYQL